MIITIMLESTMLEKNFSDIQQRIAAAAYRAKRSPADIKLVAVSKRMPTEKIIAALKLGHTVFGENYVQEALEKVPYIISVSKIKPVFHFIGKLQTNKAKKAVELFDVIETVDSIKLGMALEKHCTALNKHLAALVQVNIGTEKQKSGIPPEECEKLLRSLRQCCYLSIKGLMTMPPYFPDPENVRPYFKKLRELSTELKAKGLLGQYGPVELSMGMSGDFEVAVEEGATSVRIGSAIFGPRPQ